MEPQWGHSGQILPQTYSIVPYHHRKIRLKEDNAKCCRLNKLTCKVTLLQKFIRVYVLLIANVLRTFSHVDILNSALGSVLSPVAPLPFSLVQLSPLPDGVAKFIHSLFFSMTTFCMAFYDSYLSMQKNVHLAARGCFIRH
jgi:hypothetical protein